MLRAILVRSLWLILCGTGLAFAQDPPPLEAPASEPGPPEVSTPQPPRFASPPNAMPATPPSTVPSQVRPILVIPGVTAPATRSGAASRPNIPQSSRPSISTVTPPYGVPPSVASPSNPGSPFRTPAGAPGPGQNTLESSYLAPIPLTLEPLEDDPTPAESRPRQAAPRDTPGRPPRASSIAESDRSPANSRPTPWRMPGVLGRVLGQPSQRSTRDAASGSDTTSRATTKTNSQPDADAIAKRRIEQQIRSTLGDKVQSVEVRVNGRNVLIAARATRFWQKRSVYRALEALPALAGFRTRIDLDN